VGLGFFPPFLSPIVPAVLVWTKGEMVTSTLDMMKAVLIIAGKGAELV